MTSVTSVNNAALLILRQVNSSSSAFKDSDTKSAADQITAIVDGVSGEDSLAKTKASAAINSGLLDMQEAKDSVVSKALDFLDSDSFRSSDPSVKDTLKKLIGDDGGKFALMVKMEKANKPAISDDNAIANAIQGLIKDNRSQFGDDEFVVGFKLANGGAIIANIEDVNGNNTSNSLGNNLHAAAAAMTNAGKALRSADPQDTETLKSISAAFNNDGFSDALNAFNEWNNYLQKTFAY